MIVLGFGENLRANPGMGRDYYDDRVPTENLARLRDCVRSPSPSLRQFMDDVRGRVLLNRDAAFYEGMVCGIAMVSQLLADLEENNPLARTLYSGVRGLAGVQAGVLAGHVLEGREREERQ